MRVSRFKDFATLRMRHVTNQQWHIHCSSILDWTLAIIHTSSTKSSRRYLPPYLPTTHILPAKIQSFSWLVSKITQTVPDRQNPICQLDQEAWGPTCRLSLAPQNPGDNAKDFRLQPHFPPKGQDIASGFTCSPEHIHQARTPHASPTGCGWQNIAFGSGVQQLLRQFPQFFPSSIQQRCPALFETLQQVSGLSFRSAPD